MNTRIQCTNTDNETPAHSASFTVSTNSVRIHENGAPSHFTIVPNIKPDANIHVTILPTDTTEAVITPSQITFTPQNWSTPQQITISGPIDHILDGIQKYQIVFTVSSDDSRYDDYTIPAIQAQTLDTDIDNSGAITIRTMAANITSGNDQGYSEGHGIRIFQALKPDIVMIQEFNMHNSTEDTDEDIRELVDLAFGEEYYYYHGDGELPNGIVSRYPILDQGYWTSNVIHNRNWDWAIIDLPGPKDLLAISVHLSTDKNTQEMPVLMNKIETKISTDAANGQEYFVMIGGDFNTKKRNFAKSEMSDVFYFIDPAPGVQPYPVDQNGNSNTNSERAYPYDYLLCSYDWCNHEIPITIGEHTYEHGHVFDSRVYDDLGELEYVTPVQANDSDAKQMQHMAVIRDFRFEP